MANARVEVKKSFLTLGFAVLLFISACSQVETRREEHERPDLKRGTSVPSVPSASGSKTELPLEVEKNKRVAVILGPGGYKAFAHAGVLKELRRQNIPVHAIAGVEWGALVAGLYAQRGQISEAEWKLYKLEKLDLEKTGFFSRKPETQSLKIFEGFFRENLDLKEVRQGTVPFFCPSLAYREGTLRWQDRGPLANAVASCLASPPLFSPHHNFTAALFSTREVAHRLRQEGYNVIILVNVLGPGNLFDNTPVKDDYSTVLLWNEARRSVWEARSAVTDFIDVDTRGASFLDFASRKMLGAAGEAAGEKAAKQLVSKYGF